MRHDTVAINDLRHAEPLIRQHISAAPRIRSYALEYYALDKELGLPPSRRVWLRDYVRRLLT